MQEKYWGIPKRHLCGLLHMNRITPNSCFSPVRGKTKTQLATCYKLLCAGIAGVTAVKLNTLRNGDETDDKQGVTIYVTHFTPLNTMSY